MEWPPGGRAGGPATRGGATPFTPGGRVDGPAAGDGGTHEGEGSAECAEEPPRPPLYGWPTSSNLQAERAPWQAPPTSSNLQADRAPWQAPPTSSNLQAERRSAGRAALAVLATALAAALAVLAVGVGPPMGLCLISLGTHAQSSLRVAIRVARSELAPCPRMSASRPPRVVACRAASRSAREAAGPGSRALRTEAACVAPYGRECECEREWSAAAFRAASRSVSEAASAAASLASARAAASSHP